MRTRIDTHPDQLKRSNIPLTIVCGPPCSGKTTFVQERRKDGDQIIDLDVISRQLEPNYRPWQQTDFELLRRAIRMRNLLLLRLSKLNTGRAWFIVSSPASEEREWWKSRLGGEVVLMSTPIDECKRRALVRNTPHAVQGIDAWFTKASQGWSHPRYQHAIALDGWLLREAEDEDFCLYD